MSVTTGLPLDSIYQAGTGLAGKTSAAVGGVRFLTMAEARAQLGLAETDSPTFSRVEVPAGGQNLANANRVGLQGSATGIDFFAGTTGFRDASGNPVAAIGSAYGVSGMAVRAGARIGWASSSVTHNNISSLNTIMASPSAGEVGVYQADGITLGTLAAAGLKNLNTGRFDLSGPGISPNFGLEVNNGALSMYRQGNYASTHASAFFGKDGHVNLGGGAQTSDGLRLTSNTGEVVVKQADGTTLGTLKAGTVEAGGALRFAESATPDRMWSLYTSNSGALMRINDHNNNKRLQASGIGTRHGIWPLSGSTGDGSGAMLMHDSAAATTRRGCVGFGVSNQNPDTFIYSHAANEVGVYQSDGTTLGKLKAFAVNANQLNSQDNSTSARLEPAYFAVIGSAARMSFDPSGTKGLRVSNQSDIGWGDLNNSVNGLADTKLKRVAAGEVGVYEADGTTPGSVKFSKWYGESASPVVLREGTFSDPIITSVPRTAGFGFRDGWPAIFDNTNGGVNVLYQNGQETHYKAATFNGGLQTALGANGYSLNVGTGGTYADTKLFMNASNSAPEMLWQCNSNQVASTNWKNRNTATNVYGQSCRPDSHWDVRDLLGNENIIHHDLASKLTTLGGATAGVNLPGRLTTESDLYLKGGGQTFIASVESRQGTGQLASNDSARFAMVSVGYNSSGQRGFFGGFGGWSNHLCLGTDLDLAFSSGATGDAYTLSQGIDATMKRVGPGELGVYQGDGTTLGTIQAQNYTNSGTTATYGATAVSSTTTIQAGSGGSGTNTVNIVAGGLGVFGASQFVTTIRGGGGGRVHLASNSGINWMGVSYGVPYVKDKIAFAEATANGPFLSKVDGSTLAIYEGDETTLGTVQAGTVGGGDTSASLGFETAYLDTKRNGSTFASLQVANGGYGTFMVRNDQNAAIGWGDNTCRTLTTGLKSPASGEVSVVGADGTTEGHVKASSFTNSTGDGTATLFKRCLLRAANTSAAMAFVSNSTNLGLLVSATEGGLGWGSPGGSGSFTGQMNLENGKIITNNIDKTQRLDFVAGALEGETLKAQSGGTGAYANYEKGRVWSNTAGYQIQNNPATGVDRALELTKWNPTESRYDTNILTQGSPLTTKGAGLEVRNEAGDAFETVTASEINWDGIDSQRLNGNSWQSYEPSLTAWQTGFKQEASPTGVKLGLFETTTPVTQPAAIADSSGTTADNTAKINSILASLRSLGAIAT